MFPLLLIGVLLTGVALVSRAKAPRLKSPEILHRVTSGAPLPGMPPYHVAEVMRYLRRGIRPPEHLVNTAMHEAFDQGDYETVRALSLKFGDPDLWEAAEAGAETEQAAAEAEGVPATESSGETITVSGKSSPLDGVSNAEWEGFVAKLATEEPGFRGERHVGAYRQSRDRLRQLGIESDPETPEAQYDAITRDLCDAHQKAKGLVTAWLAQVVDVAGTEHPVTLSGLLGLLKAAGLEGASGWLANPTDRTRFPHTTDTFLATNGVF